MSVINDNIIVEKINNEFSEYWYAMHVETGEEENVKKRLDYKFEGIPRFIIPKRTLKERKDGKWYNIIRTLFPGYIFINGRISKKECAKIKTIPGVFKLLCTDNEPVQIPKDEIEIISRLISDSETIGFSDILLKDGKIIVIDGPLKSLEGRIVSVDKRKGRAKVKINLVGDERVVDLGINILKPVNE